MTMDATQTSLLTIECLRGSSKADEWNPGTPQTGDIVEEIKIGRNFACVRAPFKDGRSGVQRLLRDAFRKKQTSIRVKVRRGEGGGVVELQACIVPNEDPSGSGKGNRYVLRAIDDANYAVGFVDRTESECSELQGSRSSRVVCALSQAQLQDGYISYPWEKKTHEFLPVSNSSCFPSLLLLPKASDRAAPKYNDLEDTLARANAWLLASQASGVPILFLNVQTESLLTKISGETALSTVNAGSVSDLSNLANASLYGFEDYHGVDIGVVRAVRLWYTPIGEELAVEINLREGDTKLGFTISRTEEGFIYISSVFEGDKDDGVAALRTGLIDLYKQATKASKLLVISRVSNEKVLPWMVSSTGAVRCFNTVSLSQKLSLHRHALRPILIHVFLWDSGLASRSGGLSRSASVRPPVMPLPSQVLLPQIPIENRGSVDTPGPTLERDTAGETSFRFHNFSLSNNWV